MRPFKGGFRDRIAHDAHSTHLYRRRNRIRGRAVRGAHARRVRSNATPVAITSAGFVSVRLRTLKTADDRPLVNDLALKDFAPKVRRLDGYGGSAGRRHRPTDAKPHPCRARSRRSSLWFQRAGENVRRRSRGQGRRRGDQIVGGRIPPDAGRRKQAPPRRRQVPSRARLPAPAISPSGFIQVCRARTRAISYRPRSKAFCRS